MRRAQPWLGTVVDIAVRHPDSRQGAAALSAGFELVASLQAQLSRFDADSDIARFNALPAHGAVSVRPATQHVLRVAGWLRDHTQGRFDISLGTGCHGWRLDGAMLRKITQETSLDLGGIAKGYVVDRVTALLRRHGSVCTVVNAGGDLRVWGPAAVPIQLRREHDGGLVDLAPLRQGALASSYYGANSRSQLAGHAEQLAVQVAVQASTALQADALCKLAALGFERESSIFQRWRAQTLVWRH